MGFWDGSGLIWTICTSLQIDNRTNTSSFNYYRPDAVPDAQPNVRIWKSEINPDKPLNDVFITVHIWCASKLTLST